jgi:tRNA G26 N,N-dimethylase Trm1
MWEYNMSLEEFVEKFLKDHAEEVEEILELIDTVKDVLPNNAFYFTIQVTCNEH